MVFIKKVVNLWEMLLILYLLTNFKYVKEIFNHFFITCLIFLEVYFIIEDQINIIIVILSIISFVILNYIAFKVYKYKKDNKEKL